MKRIGCAKGMRRAAALALALVLTMPALPGMVAAQSGSNWASFVSVTDLTGNAPLQPSQPLIAGHAYNVTMKVTVPFTQNSSHFTATLGGVLLGYQGQLFWYVKTPHYPGYNASSSTPGSRTITFTQVAGTLVVSTIFQVPLSITLYTSMPQNFTRHITFSNLTLVSVSVTGGSPPTTAQVGQLSDSVEDQTIQTYLDTYQAKSTLISSGQIDPAYSSIVNGILAQAQALYLSGLPAQGTSLLQTLNPASFPAPPSTTTSTGLLVGIVVAAIVIILLAVMVVRGRGKRGFSEGIVAEVQKELALLEVTAAKYDKALADRLQALRNRLGEAD
jgi:hypothetical protein